MKLAQLDTKGCRSIPDASYSLRAGDGSPANLVVVTGPPGAGKTTFLELVIATKEVIGPYLGLPNAALIVKQGQPGARILSAWQLSEAEANGVGLPSRDSETEVLFSRNSLSSTSADPGIAAIMGRFSTKFDVGILDYYPDDRALPAAPAGQEISEFELKRTRFDRGSRKYVASAAFAKKLWGGGHDPDGRGAIAKSILSLVLPYLKPVGLNGMGQLEFHRTSGEAVPLDRLSASEKQAVLFATTPVLLGLKNSIVLIDTPELYLGKGEALRLIGALRDNLPDNQWIVATRDEELIGSAQQEGVLVQLGSQG